MSQLDLYKVHTLRIPLVLYRSAVINIIMILAWHVV